MSNSKYFLVSGIAMLAVGSFLNFRWGGAVFLVTGFVFLALGAVINMWNTD